MSLPHCLRLHCRSHAQIETFRQQQQSGADPSQSDQQPWKSWWIVRVPTSLFREEVELPPSQNVLRRLQLPLDCLTFFINSQVILFPWQQFPADTKNQVSPSKFKSVVGSLGVFPFFLILYLEDSWGHFLDKEITLWPQRALEVCSKPTATFHLIYFKDKNKSINTEQRHRVDSCPDVSKADLSYNDDELI